MRSDDGGCAYPESSRIPWHVRALLFGCEATALDDLRDPLAADADDAADR